MSIFLSVRARRLPCSAIFACAAITAPSAMAQIANLPDGPAEYSDLQDSWNPADGHGATPEGQVVSLCKLDDAWIGFMANYLGVPNEMALAQMDDLRIDELSGSISFSVRLTSGAVPLSGNSGLVPKTEQWDFSGYLDSESMRGTMTISPLHSGRDRSATEEMKVFSRTTNDATTQGQELENSCDAWFQFKKSHEEFLAPKFLSLP